MSVIVSALTVAAAPYRQTRQFHQALRCEQAGGACFTEEIVSITERKTFEYSDDSTAYALTWQRSDGSSQSHDVRAGIHAKARVGLHARIERWHDQTVGITVEDQSETFLPGQAGLLGLWLWLAYFGLGITLWGLFGWWDGLLSLYGRAFLWCLIGALPFCFLAPRVLAHGVQFDPGFILMVVFACFFALVGATGLVSLLDREQW
ncbi:hypothetical protein [Nocardia bovistercoris]|uniref:Uncharacterized protein n=1 Tax=Nocardia bovistercoris TaxID=2785916 RepID=A0A931IC34_9NOCA|nr:hypothetical protein [Nocardia bovistercoris]MBH0777811.1 hypothetical protein [Nocardia bovistercoris]